MINLITHYYILMSYKEVELYGRKIRLYSGEHIEMEMRGKKDNWWVKPIHIAKSGHYSINFKVNGKQKEIKVHRLIFYIHNPSWDIYDISMDNFVDHRNGEPADNRIENLHIVSHQENQLNRPRAKGYSWNKKHKKWVAEIMINRKSIYLGMYAEESDARNAYLAAKLKYHIIEERVF
jgi:hypothetical protein